MHSFGLVQEPSSLKPTESLQIFQGYGFMQPAVRACLDRGYEVSSRLRESKVNTFDGG